jgi:REP element-mobilizing transposase RayT
METENKFKNIYRIKSARKAGYDYTNDGWYFVTICTKNMEPFFGKITDGKMNLSEIGKIVENYWLEISKHFPFVELDEFSIMPNHTHGIIGINNFGCHRDGRDEALPRLYDGKYPQMSEISPKPKSLSAIVGSFKSVSTKTIHQKSPETNFAWQLRFYDRIIRNEKELDKIRKYIFENPLKWEFDRNNPENFDISP